MASHKNIEASINNLEVLVDQLAKQFSNLRSCTFSSNTKNNSKENYNIIVRDEKIIKAKQERAEDLDEEEVQNESCKEKLMDLPKKEVDPIIVVLYVSIGNMEIDNALVDLGANVNIMSLLLVDRFGYL